MWVHHCTSNLLYELRLVSIFVLKYKWKSALPAIFILVDTELTQFFSVSWLIWHYFVRQVNPKTNSLMERIKLIMQDSTVHVIIHSTIKKIQKNINIIIIHKKIYLHYHFTVPGLAKMEIDLGRKIGISQNWNPENWREHCLWSLTNENLNKLQHFAIYQHRSIGTNFTMCAGMKISRWVSLTGMNGSIPV